MRPGFLKCGKKLADDADGPAVLRPGLIVGANHLGAFLAVGNSLDPGTIDTLGNEKVAGRRSTPIPEGKVVFTGAAFIGVTLNRDPNGWVGAKESCLCVKRGFCIRGKGRTVEIKIDLVADADQFFVLGHR
mgnify:CR=1 FL=1